MGEEIPWIPRDPLDGLHGHHPPATLPASMGDPPSWPSRPGKAVTTICPRVPSSRTQRLNVLELTLGRILSLTAFMGDPETFSTDDDDGSFPWGFQRNPGVHAPH